MQGAPDTAIWDRAMRTQAVIVSKGKISRAAER
jgi:hypothetical protein